MNKTYSLTFHPYAETYYCLRYSGKYFESDYASEIKAHAAFLERRGYQFAWYSTDNMTTNERPALLRDGIFNF